MNTAIELDRAKIRLAESEQRTAQQTKQIDELRLKLIQACGLLEKATALSFQEPEVKGANTQFCHQCIKYLRDLDALRAVEPGAASLKSETP